tara:strand:+ start:39 stop:2294 length:2256 start_codon:yes stop_codon:yes gene_type:complete
MADDIKLVVGVDYSELTGLVKTGEQTKRALGAVAKDFAKTNDQQRYMRSINQIVQAQNKLHSSARLSRSEIMKMGNQMRQEAQFADALAKSTSRLGAAYGFAGKKVNRMGVGLQQAGYQVGDFAVQIQGGTNAAVALGQQGSQLLGIFGPAGAIAGAALAIGTAIVAPLIKANKEAETLIGTLEGFATSYESRMSMLRFGLDTEEEAAAQEKLLELTRNDMRIRREMAETDSLSKRLRLSEELQANRELLIPIRLAVEALREKREQYELLASLAQSEAQEAENLRANERNAAREAHAEREAERKIAADYQALVERTNASYEDQVALLTLIKVKGEDHADVARLRFDQEGRRKGLLDGELDTYVSQQMVLRRIVLETEAAAVEAALVRDGLSESVVEAMKLAGIDLSEGITPAVLAAGMLATNLGIALSAAQQIQLTQTSLRNRNQVYSGRGTVGMPSETDTGGAFAPSRDTVEQADILLGLRDPAKSGGGGGSDPFDQDAYLKSLQEEADFKRTLVGMTEEQATVEERRREIMEKMTQDGQTLSEADEKRIQTIINTEAATRSLIEAEEQRQATMDMVSGHIESAFMAMIDGSKSVEDAFKGMLRAILLDVYKQQVAGPLAKSIGGFLSGLPIFNANGNAFSGGNVIPFANGGVVSSATMFPMAGNQTGVMGEAGPEAIMPLKRGANGKLGVQVQGGGENVVVNQSFNFQANGDDSVKKIIAQAAPQIANMTQKQIMDSRRRGGAMKSTFG